MYGTFSLRLMAAVLAGLVGAVMLADGLVAAERPSFISDAEIENTIRIYSKPVFQAAGLDANAVRIHLVSAPELNAFVAGGQRIFITTGLLLASANAEQLIGVIAHETGHIAGGHLARLQEALDRASNQAMISQILAILVGIGAGEAGGAVAIGAGGVGVAEQTLLRYTRIQEQAADQAAVGFLDAAGISSRGLRDILDKLSEQELLAVQRQDAYVRTHPLTRERVRFVENHFGQSRNRDAKLPAAFDEMHRRMRAKLAGFLNPPGHTLQKYAESDASLEARYARAVAYYRVPDLGHALPLIDGLIAERPTDPYFHELKGQILFENSRVREAVEPYQRAVELVPAEPLLRVALAHAMIELNDPQLTVPALDHLRAALRVTPDLAQAWQLAANAYGRNGEFGMSALALAEYSLLTGSRPIALQQATRAERQLTKGSPSWLRAQDIKLEAERRR